jgi:hypothetical protein
LSGEGTSAGRRDRLRSSAGALRREVQREARVVDLQLVIPQRDLKGAPSTPRRSRSPSRSFATPPLLSVAFSPVSTQEPVTCHSSWSISARTSPRLTAICVCTYSTHPPNALWKYQRCGE